MPSGVDAFRRKQEQRQQQKETTEAARGISTNDFKPQGGKFYHVRFLEQGDDLTFADTHRIPMTAKSGKQYFRTFICLDTFGDGTPCPACQHQNPDIAKQGTRGFVNLIQREGPVFAKKMVDGRERTDFTVVVGREDQVALWECSWTVFELLKDRDAKYKGLMSRDFEVRREGSTMNDTKYYIDPADVDSGPQPMMIADLALTEKKYDLKVITKTLEYATFAQILNRGSYSDGPQPTMDRSAAVPSAASTFNGEPQVRSSAFQRG